MKNKGISCFSTEFDNMLMWAYYADGHKGMCLEFNTEYEPFSKIHKVKYSNETPTVDANIILNDSTDHHEIVEAYLLSKYEDWSHEREWRILHTQNRITFGYKSNALTGIYFGSKISFTDLEIIALIIKGQHSNCKFYQMEKVPGEFKIIPRELNYTTFQEAKNIVLKNIQPKLDIGVSDLNELTKDLNLATSESHLRTIVEAILDDLKITKST
ncbi:MAG: DUF2971 domain-containing protein [Lewinellaceae bacterium]|nr:DUF2971 domain-containing protein [Lewinellaceae bacterium]